MNGHRARPLVITETDSESWPESECSRTTSQDPRKGATGRSWVWPLMTSWNPLILTGIARGWWRAWGTRRWGRWEWTGWRSKSSASASAMEKSKNLWRGDWEPHRVLRFNFSFLTVIYGDWFIPDVNDEVDSDLNEASGLAGDQDEGVFEEFANTLLQMPQDLVRTTTKYTTMQILESVRAVTTSEVSRLCCNMMSAWNLAMMNEK